jgi:hypothetical protein
VPELVRGIVLLNSAGQFGNPNAPPKVEEAEEEVSALTRLVVKPIKEAFQKVVLGFLFWQAKQPARVEKVLKSVREATDKQLPTDTYCHCYSLSLPCVCRCTKIPAMSMTT